MKQPPTLKPLHAYLVANGDLRLSANQKCWPARAKMENKLAQALRAEGWKVVRAHEFDPAKKHGFIDSQKMGLEVFRQLERHLARTRRPVELERLADQNGCAVQHYLERDLHRPFFQKRPAPLAR